MNIEMLPDDILHAIFRKMLGNWVIRCRSVCRRLQEAVDSLSDQDWKVIIHNCTLYKDYVEARKKYGLSWKDAYKALNSWKGVSSAKLSSQKFCENIEHFKVLPNGIVACLQNTKTNDLFGISDTVVYYNTETFKKCYKDEYEKPFLSPSYDENEYFKVMIQFDGDMCIVNKNTKEKTVVEGLSSSTGLFVLAIRGHYGTFNLIGKEIYYKKASDEVIYVSKLIDKDGVSKVETNPLEAFIENHDSYQEDIVAICTHKGNVNILSDEGNKGNIYVHENADLGWVGQLYYDQSDIFLELEVHGFNWRTPQIYNWLRSPSGYIRPAFYSHGSIFMTTRSYGKTLCIHYFPCYIYGPEHLLKLFKGKPLRKITTQEITGETKENNPSVTQLDIIETSTNHKVLALVGENLYILEFLPAKDNKKNLQPTKVKLDKKALKNKQLQVLKNKTAKKKLSYTAKKKKIAPTQKKTAKAKNSVTRNKKLLHKHSYATRSTTKM